MDSVTIQTAEAIEAGQRFMKELQDIIDATEDASGDSNDAMGHNGKRSAANDGINITRNILRRLGAAPVEAKRSEPPAQSMFNEIDEAEARKLKDEAEWLRDEGDDAQADEIIEKLETVQEALAEAAEPEANYDEPPAEIADLIDPTLTAKQNLDVLTAKFAAAKNAEEYARSQGDMTAAMSHLRDAERFESGITWNRAVLAEVV